MDPILIAAVILAALNLVSFALMAIDKHRARTGRRRIRERTLLLTAACFGALGGCAGMALCHHKTRKRRFRVLMPLMLLMQAALLGVALWLTRR